jgi:hypothetical protein
VQSGGVFFQRYNGNGVDPNRDWPDLGYSFRPYSGASEPETNAFLGFYDGVRAAGPFTAGDDLHGQPEADALSYTLLPRRHTLGGRRHPRGRHAINRSTYGAVKWSPIVSSNDEVAEPEANPDPCVGAATPHEDLPDMGSVMTPSTYTTTARCAIVRLKPAARDLIDNEMAFSHLDKNIVFDQHTEQMHQRSSTPTRLDALAPVSARRPGAQGYAQHPGHAPGRSAGRRAQNNSPTSKATATLSAEGWYIPRPRRAATPGSRIYDGACAPGHAAQRPASPTGAPRPPSSASTAPAPRHRPAEQVERLTVAETTTSRRCTCRLAWWRRSTGCRPPIATARAAHQVRGASWSRAHTAGSGKIDAIHVGAASTDGNTNGADPPVLKGCDVANTDFFSDLDGLSPTRPIASARSTRTLCWRAVARRPVTPCWPTTQRPATRAAGGETRPGARRRRVSSLTSPRRRQGADRGPTSTDSHDSRSAPTTATPP